MFITKLNETMTDKEVIKFFERATGRKYKATETCVNDIRRICLTFWNEELQKRLNKVRS